MNAFVVVKFPVSWNNRVGAEYMPPHDDVGGGHVVHVEADEGKVVDVAGDCELAIQDDVRLHRLNVGLGELSLSLDQRQCVVCLPPSLYFLWSLQLNWTPEMRN